MAEYPLILGVFSLNLQKDLGTGATQQAAQTVTYWYARQISDEEFEIQPLNVHHVPSGIRSQLAKNDFLSQYTPEPGYYKKHTVPALKTLQRKVEEGEKQFSAGNLDQAEREFLKALMIDELNVKANYGLGEVYSEKQEFEKLKKVLDVLLTLDEAFEYEHRQRFNSFGISLRKNGHFEESIRYYRKSLELNNKDEHVYFNLARAHFDKGELEPCIEALKLAIRINPEFLEARKFLKYCNSATA